MLDSFARLLTSFYWNCLRRPVITVSVILGAVAFMAGGMPKLKSVVAARDLFEDGTEAAANFDTISREFDVGNPVMLLVRPRSGKWNAADLCSLQGWMTDQSMNHPEIRRISSPFDLREVVTDPTHFGYRRILHPCSESAAPIDDQFAKLRETFVFGTFIARYGNDLAIELNFRDTPGGSRRGRFDPAPIAPVQKDFERALGDKFDAVWSGASMYDHHVANGMKRFPFMNAGVLLLMILLYRIYTGSWKSGAILATTLAITGVFVFGGMGRIGHAVDVLASTIFLLVTIAAHQDFSFVTSSQMDRPEDFRRTFRRFLVPSFFTSLTTMIGFYSLCLSDLTIIRHFGLWAGTGALFEWIMIMIFLPSFLTLVRPLRTWTRVRTPIFARFRGLDARKYLPGPRLARALLFLLVLTPWAVWKVNVSDDPKALFPASHPFRAAIAYVKESRGWENTLDLLFPAHLPAEERGKILERIAKLPFVEKVEDGEGLVRFLKKGLSADDQMIVDSQIETAGILRRYRSEDRRDRAILYVRSSDLIEYRAFRKSVAEFCDREKCRISGLVDLYTEYTYSVSRTLAESLVVSLILVTILMVALIRARKTPNGTLLILTSFWGPLVMLIILAALQLPLNVYTCNCASVLVGLTGDNAIQFIFANRKGRLEEGLTARRDGAIFTSLTMAICCLVFLAAVFTPPRILGALLFFGFISCIVGDYWLLKGLLKAKGHQPDEVR